LATASGVDLILGHISYQDPTNGQLQQKSGAPDLWLVGAAAAIVVGLFIAMIERGRDAAGAMLATSLVALCLCFIGVQAAHQLPQSGQANAGDQAMNAAAMSLISIDNRYGFYVTVAALAAAAGLCLLVFGQRSALVGGRLESIPSPTPPRPSPARPPPSDPDLTFWDGMPNKDDPDLLAEYLIRFPQGRFVELALVKLARQSSANTAEQAEPAAFAPVTPSPAACPHCGAETAPGSRFCEDCGAPLSGPDT